MIQRNVPDTPAPAYAPQSWKPGMLDLTVVAATASPVTSENTTVEWPSEKKNPTPSDRLSSCRNFRVVLSIAAMWSASNAWRRPKV